MEEINAYIYGKRIGTMIEHQGVIYFEYDKKFKLEGLEISPIKLHTSKTKDAYTNPDHINLYKGIAGVFFDSLPDKHGMPFIDRYFEKQGLKPFEVTLLHKLAFIGDRGMGAIEYVPKEDDTAVTSDIAINAKEAYEEMKQGIQSDDSSIESLMNIRQSVSPIGGGRPKMLVQYNYDTKEIRLNKKELHQGYIRAIIKFDEIYEGVGSIGLTKLEYLFMSMAKEVGINTSEFQLINEGDAKHLLVKRFDRDDNDEKIHMCTAAGLMHLDISILKATSYEYLFMLTRNVCKSQENIEELFKRMILNILCLNFDDHAKNFAYLMDKNGKWSLSPAYDITYSKGLMKSHTTTVCGKDSNITRNDVLKIAKAQGIKTATAIKIIDSCCKIVKTFEQKAKELELDINTLESCKSDINNQIKLLLMI
ncbi:MAG: type II toxin-antitoxin system HipA family toxin [Aliarcobacter sp.]|jgi:serine/threonine-protein kinase HipA|nr:type II toxin-antitoxin system HipA family toxin [Aliarcobacter sp.]